MTVREMEDLLGLSRIDGPYENGSHVCKFPSGDDILVSKEFLAEVGKALERYSCLKGRIAFLEEELRNLRGYVRGRD